MSNQNTQRRIPTQLPSDHGVVKAYMASILNLDELPVFLVVDAHDKGVRRTDHRKMMTTSEIHALLPHIDRRKVIEAIKSLGRKGRFAAYQKGGFPQSELRATVKYNEARVTPDDRKLRPTTAMLDDALDVYMQRSTKPKGARPTAHVPGGRQREHRPRPAAGVHQRIGRRVPSVRSARQPR